MIRGKGGRGEEEGRKREEEGGRGRKREEEGGRGRDEGDYVVSNLLEK
jgi:hypothetical protein